ncbi:MAG: hypothetical protein ACRDPO_37845 [Streptosporangiaceae bacterium]
MVDVHHTPTSAAFLPGAGDRVAVQLFPFHRSASSSPTATQNLADRQDTPKSVTPLASLVAFHLVPVREPASA